MNAAGAVAGSGINRRLFSRMRGDNRSSNALARKYRAFPAPLRDENQLRELKRTRGTAGTPCAARFDANWRYFVRVRSQTVLLRGHLR